MADEHEFGGPWTEVKLDAISDYLAFYTGALKNKPRPNSLFQLWYVDAFAGSGERTSTMEVGGLLEGRPASFEKIQIDGSAKRALAVTPSFKRFVFIEQDPGRFASLRRLESENPERAIVTLQGDGNAALETLFSTPPWSLQRTGGGLHRAVVFLDPYNMAVKWKTLELLARTGAIDLWYLFPLSAVVRQLARDFSAVDGAKQAALDEVFGTANWRQELYEQRIEHSLFDEVTTSTHRVASKRQIEAYAKKRLEELFPFVSEALPLLTNHGSQLFSLFCASANPSPAARDLVIKGVKSVLKKYR